MYLSLKFSKNKQKTEKDPKSHVYNFTVIFLQGQEEKPKTFPFLFESEYLHINIERNTLKSFDCFSCQPLTV